MTTFCSFAAAVHANHRVCLLLNTFPGGIVARQILGNGFMITVTNIGTFHDHFANYEKVNVWCSWCS